jgi:hypothetical protein
MRVRVGAELAALLVLLGCGRTGLELDTPEASGASTTSGGSGPAGGAGSGSGGSSGLAGAGGLSPCSPAFSSNTPDGGTAVSTMTIASVGVVCATQGAVDRGTLSLRLDSVLGPVAGELAWDEATSQLTFVPAAPLALATEYTATAAVPGAELIWSFTTVDGAWQREEELGQGGDLALGVSPDGHGLIAFRGGGDIHLRRFTLQDGPAKNEEVIVDAGVAPRTLRVGVAERGLAVVAWSTEGGSVRGRRAKLDDKFAPSPGLDPLVGPARVEDLALAGDGTGLLVTSVRSNPNDAAMLRAIPVELAGFGPASTLSSVAPLEAVRVLARPGGRSWALWSSWTETGRVLGRYAASGVIEPQRVLAEPAARAGFAAMLTDGSAFVVWQEGSPPRAVSAARFTPGGEPAVAAVLDTTVPAAPSSGAYARIAVDELGRALVLWVNQGEADAGIVEQVRAQRFDGGWARGHAALTGVTVGEWAVISPLGLALDPHGNGFAGFGHGAPARAWVRRFRPSAGWEPPLELSESATAPLLAVDRGGRAAIAWSSGGKVFFRRFIELTAPRPRH